MAQASTVNWDMTLILPLGVVANQLSRIESQLRDLNMKALELARHRDAGLVPGLVGAKLEHIGDALEGIRALVAGMHADIRPKSTPSRDD